MTGDLDIEDGAPEPCPRCGAPDLVWVTSSLHCPRCGYHAGCCEGVPQTYEDYQDEITRRGSATSL